VALQKSETVYEAEMSSFLCSGDGKLHILLIIIQILYLQLICSSPQHY